MKRFYLLTLMFVATLFTSCGDSSDIDNVDPTPTPPPPAQIEVDTPANVTSMDGNERVILRWEVNPSSSVTKTVIYYDNNNSYKEYPFNANGGSEMQACEAIIKSLEEGEYSFQIANRDKDGNESKKITVAAKAYGQEYISKLESRPIIEWEYLKKERKLTIMWQEDWKQGIGTEVTNPTDVENIKHIWVENSDNTTVIEDVDEGVAINVQTHYQPENCFDVLYAEPYTIIPEAEIIPVAAPANVASMDGYKRVKLMWDVDVESTVTKSVIYWDNKEAYKELEFKPKTESGLQRCEIIIENLTENDYTFELINVDEDGYQSNPITVTAKVYGDHFVSELSTREVTDVVHDNDTKVATLTLESWGLGDKSIIEYQDLTTKSTVSIDVNNSTNTVTLDNIDAEQTFTIHTLYTPDNCMDTMHSTKHSYSTPVAEEKPTSNILEIKVMQLNVATGNILTALFGGSHYWSDRCAKISSMIKDNDIDIIGLQELRDSPSYYYSNLLSSLGSSYSGVCYARTSKSDKEGLAIIYRSDKFELISEGRYWLNMVDPSRELILDNGGYVANYYRIAVYAILREKSTGQEFYFTTAHLDNNDVNNGIIKTWQAQLLINHTNARSGYDNGANRFIIVTGDMNSNPEREAIKRFTSSTQNYVDTWSAAESRSCPDASKPRSTMVDITESSATQNNACFDYIFVKGGSPRIVSHTIHSAQSGSVVMSDHNAVSTVLQYKISK